MVYIRSKKVKGDQYLYLVKSVWDSKRNTSKQEIVKYLGKSSKIVKDDIPIDYRNDPKILSFLAAHNPEDIKKREIATEKTKEQLYQKFSKGDLHGSIHLYENYTKLFKMSDFFDKILKPVMYKIGEDWASGKISVATEHVSSNVAQSLVKIILNQKSTLGKKRKILICVPTGEEHRIGCDVMETYLSGNGFRVLNIGASAPTESILRFIEEQKPDVVFVSITLEDNIRPGQRLVNKIKDQYDIPVFVGGYAINTSEPKFNAKIIKNPKLEELPKIIKTA